jgi:predicted nuclease with TOPRIM domain
MQELSLGATELVTAIAVGFIGLIIGVQKLLKGWKETATESNIISIMHTELERMSIQNTKLAEELNKLQIEIIQLNKELRNLSFENQRLHAEVSSLTAEVGRLQQVLSKHNIDLL